MPLFLGATVGHGYRAWLAGVWRLVLFVVGSVVFDLAYPEHSKPAKRVGEIPAFQPLIYTLDLILPISQLPPARRVDRPGLAQGVRYSPSVAGS